MTDCIFCRIVSRESPVSIVFEDAELLAFPTIQQTCPGELLVIPKQHIDHICDVPEGIAARMAVLGQRLARVLQAKFQPMRVGWVVSGFGVSHAHLIVLPLHHEQDITSQRYITVEGGEVRFGMAHIPETPRRELDMMASDIAAALGR